MRRLWCALRKHRIDYFRAEPHGVTSLVYRCDCARSFVSRGEADAMIGDWLDAA